MKKWLSIFFLSLYILSSTELGEVFKVNNLISHFFEHKGISEEISFSEYIYHHYFNHGENDQDGEKDQNLPFNSHSEVCSLISQIPFIPNSQDLNIQLHSEFTEYKSELIFHQDKCYSFELTDIWLPPKLI